MLVSVTGSGNELFLKIYEESGLSSLNLLWIGRANSCSHTLTGVENSQTLSVHLWQRAANAASSLPSPPVSSSMLHLGFSHLCLPPHFLHAAPAPSSSSGASGHLIPNPDCRRCSGCLLAPFLVLFRLPSILCRRGHRLLCPRLLEDQDPSSSC